MGFSRLNLLGQSLAEVKHFWFAIEVIAIALWFSLQPQTTEPVIRLWGLVLQLLGILTVAWGISETRALFGRPSIATTVNAWLGRFPLKRRQHVIGTGTGHIGIFGMHGRGHTSFQMDPGAKVEDRLTAIEKNIGAIQDRISQTQGEMDKRFSESEAALKNEQSTREEQDRLIHDKLEATGTGGVHISAIGAAWLFVGVVLSTAAIEIAKALK